MKLLLCLLLYSFALVSLSTDRPNILFILADDLGYGDVGVYPNQNSTHGRLSTPVLDALAKESMMFTDAYAGAPVCAPSRCALMTGRHTGHCTVRQNGQVLENDYTVANLLQDAGYSTALIGKWGLSSAGLKNAKNVPTEKGFDYFFGCNSQENCHNYYPSFLWRNTEEVEIVQNQNASNTTCGTPYTQHCVWSQDLFTNETVEFLANVSTGKLEKPFYLFLSFTTPHAGGVGTNKENGEPAPYETPQYREQTWPRSERDFASLVTLQDQHVGDVLKALDKYGLANNTVVFYASDNGAHNEGGHDYHFFESSGPLTGFKRSIYEGGMRSPLLVRWPSVMKGGSVSDHQWGFWDFMSTAADLAEIPATKIPPNDGLSLVPTLRGEQQDQPEYVYFEYCDPIEKPGGWGQSVRFYDWKAIRYDYSSKVQLFDLSKDISESVDLADTSPELVARAVGYMDDAHEQGPYCGYLPPYPNI